MITLPLTDLRAILGPLLKCAPARSTLPVLSHVLVHRVRNTAIFSATDLDRWLDCHHTIEPMPHTTLAVKLAELRWARETGPDFLVPIETLRAVLRAAKHGDVSLRKEGVTYELNGQPATLAFDAPFAAEFPPRPEAKDELEKKGGREHPALPLESLDRDAFVQAIPFCSENTRGPLDGVFLNSTHLTAAQGTRVFQHELSVKLGTAIVPMPAAQLLAMPAMESLPWQARLIQLREGEAANPASAAHLRLRFDCGTPGAPGQAWTLWTRCQDGVYPNVRQVIPSDLSQHGTVAITEAVHRGLLRVLAELPPVNPKHPFVCIAFQPDRIELRDEGSQVTGTAPGTTAYPQHLLIRRDSLRAALGVCPPAGGAVLHFLDPASPVVLTVPAGVVVLAPVKARADYDWPRLHDDAADALAQTWKGGQVECLLDSGEAVLGEVTGIVRFGRTHRARVKVLDKRETILTPDEVTVSFVKLTITEPAATAAA